MVAMIDAADAENVERLPHVAGGSFFAGMRGEEKTGVTRAATPSLPRATIARPDPSLFADAALAHKLAAWGIAFLIALHVAGALKHHFLDGDDVLKRMLPRSSASVRHLK